MIPIELNFDFYIFSVLVKNICMFYMNNTLVVVMNDYSLLRLIRMSFNSFRNHNNSDDISTTWYFASTLEQVTVVFFLSRHEISELPQKE